MVREFPRNDKDAVISDCENYRYVLYRKIKRQSEKSLCFICLNPSTADAKEDDPTVRRCMRFARDGGYGGLYLVNLFAWRDKEKRVLLETPKEKVGPCCDYYIDRYVKNCDMTIAAWGAIHPGLEWRARDVSGRHDNLSALKITEGGHPWHPSRAPGNFDPVEFPGYA